MGTGPVEYAVIGFPGNKFKGEIAPALRLLRRSSLCLQYSHANLDMLEQMSPWEYTRWIRPVLGHGSGFDSPGFRELRRVLPALGHAFHRLRRAAGLSVADVYVQGREREDLYQLAEALTNLDGNREFTFYRSVPAADELLAPEDIRRESLSGASFANFGSIPLIKDPVRSATRKFAQLAIEMDVPVALDVNLREHLWKSLDEFRETIEPMLGLATVIKLSADELV
jgi:hypothetical protein